MLGVLQLFAIEKDSVDVVLVGVILLFAAPALLFPSSTALHRYY